MERNKVVLVDHRDRAIGEMDKMEAHNKGVLHRAFSVFIFNKKGELLIQQRAKQKYHGADLWTNTCCSHPQRDEDVKKSASERLEHEMGLKCDLEFLFSFQYKAAVENQLIENEFDHVFIGYSDLNPKPKASEVQDFRWVSKSGLLAEIKAHPEYFTYWFKEIIPRIWRYHHMSI